jgi:hypothetical protein
MIYHFLKFALLVLAVSCSEVKTTDEHHYLNDEQHFLLSSNPISILKNGDNIDTLYFAGLINAQYVKHFYGGACKGAVDYLYFESVYFSFRQDTAAVIDRIKLTTQDYYVDCYDQIPCPARAINFLYVANNKNKVPNSPVMYIGNLNFGGKAFLCDNFIKSIVINSIEYNNVFRYTLNCDLIISKGTINEILFSRSEGVIRITSVDKGEWIKIN